MPHELLGAEGLLIIFLGCSVVGLVLGALEQKIDDCRATHKWLDEFLSWIV